jgi:glycine/D-amino acid oxidase-like deaminating enzyme
VGELLDPAAVRAAEPELTGPVLGASWFAADLQVDARAIARALAGAPGVELREGCAVRGLAVSGGRVVGVETDAGVIAAGAVVVCAGVWTGPLAAGAGLALPLEPRKGQLVRLRVAAPEPRRIRHKVVDGSYLASVLSPSAGLEVTTVLETTWEGHVLVGSSRERRGFDVTVDDAVSDAMRARAARLMPALAALPVDAAWAGLRPWLPDHLPAIGPSAAAEGLWIATGHEGAGVALGPVTGRCIAAALCGEPPPVDLAPFSPDRFT